MKSERPTDSADADAASQWLDALAGRASAGVEHADGTRVRAALMPQGGDRPAANWRDIEARAASDDAATPGVAPGGASSTAVPARSEPAANDPPPWRWLGWAAAVVLVVGLVTLMPPTTQGPETGLRGVGGDSPSGPQWVVERPVEAAEALAAELRGLKAEVTVTREGNVVILQIRTQAGAVDAVNARLAALETGLDATGRLDLRVVPVR